MIRKYQLAALLVFLCGIFSLQSLAQSYSLSLKIKNQPDQQIVLGWISGDNFTKIDSAKANLGQVTFHFPTEAPMGVYRVLLGKTTYAEVMNKPPQQFDIIFNNENIALSTDFDKPIENMTIEKSLENQIWFDFKKKQEIYTKELNLLQKQLDALWSLEDTSGMAEQANAFNFHQIEWELRMMQTVQKHHNLLVSKLISTTRQPYLDGFFPPEERSELRKQDYLLHVDFTHEELINSAAYTDKVFDYLVLFNKPTYTKEQRTQAYTPAIDLLMDNIQTNKNVKEFLTQYLIHGFEVLQMPLVIEHIKSK
jgi:hypothetical protein